MRYYFIVPVYNRPDEVDELLQSLTKQTLGNFEVLVIEDGSSVPCEDVVEKYRTLLDVHYYISRIQDRGRRVTLEQNAVGENIC